MHKQVTHAIALGIVALLGLAGPAAAATNVYVKFNDIDGDVLEQGFETHIEVLEYHHLVNGAIAGNHEPIVFVKQHQESSTVDLLQSFDLGTLHQVTFSWVVDAGVGGRHVLLQIDLQQARIVAIEPWSRNGADGTDELERLRIDYQSIEITHEALDSGGIPEGPESYGLVKP